MSGTLPSWLQRLFGIHAGPGQDIAWSLESRWPWPPWVTLLAIALAAALVAAVYFHENRRASAAAAPCWPRCGWP